MDGYLIKKVMYIDANGKAHESIKNALPFKFESDAYSAAIENRGQIIKVKQGRKSSRLNQGWMRK